MVSVKNKLESIRDRHQYGLMKNESLNDLAFPFLSQCVAMHISVFTVIYVACIGVCIEAFVLHLAQWISVKSRLLRFLLSIIIVINNTLCSSCWQQSRIDS